MYQYFYFFAVLCFFCTNAEQIHHANLSTITPISARKGRQFGNQLLAPPITPKQPSSQTSEVEFFNPTEQPIFKPVTGLQYPSQTFYGQNNQNLYGQNQQQNLYSQTSQNQNFYNPNSQPQNFYNPNSQPQTSYNQPSQNQNFYGQPGQNQNPAYIPVGNPNQNLVNGKGMQFTHNDQFRIYFFEDKLSLYCATDTVYDKVTWRRFDCPKDIGVQNGEVVASESMVSRSEMYAINTYGRNEQYVSELLIKQPLTPTSEGLYVCESRLLTARPGEVNTVTRDLVFVAGKYTYDRCFGSRLQPKRLTNPIFV